MQQRRLGRTELRVSELALGTVSLGCDYGIDAPGGRTRPERHAAAAVLETARSRGINLFDTAPAYGVAEELLGEVLRGDPEVVVAGKVALAAEFSPAAGGKPDQLQGALRRQVQGSLRALRRDQLEILQIHNATPAQLADERMMSALVALKREGCVRFLGASVYGVPAALAAVGDERIDLVQVAYNILDQRMATEVFPSAARLDKGLLVRSAFLKGALTFKSQWLPESEQPLARAVAALKHRLGIEWDRLPGIALQFCLQPAVVSAVLIGPRTREELLDALNSEQNPPLSEEWRRLLESASLETEEWVNPVHWTVQ